MSCRQRDDQIVIVDRQRRSDRDQTAIQSTRKFGEEQPIRFLVRIHDPMKQWKLSQMDLQSRVRWEDYTKAKEDAGTLHVDSSRGH